MDPTRGQVWRHVSHLPVPCVHAVMNQAISTKAHGCCRFRGAGGGRLLQRRGVLVVRRLAALLGAVPTLRLLSQLLEDEQDLPFASAMVQALNLILLTVPEVILVWLPPVPPPPPPPPRRALLANAMVQALNLILLTVPEVCCWE